MNFFIFQILTKLLENLQNNLNIELINLFIDIYKRIYIVISMSTLKSCFYIVDVDLKICF
jgi:hypothetical protein